MIRKSIGEVATIKLFRPYVDESRSAVVALSFAA